MIFKKLYQYLLHRTPVLLPRCRKFNLNTVLKAAYNNPNFLQWSKRNDCAEGSKCPPKYTEFGYGDKAIAIQQVVITAPTAAA